MPGEPSFRERLEREAQLAASPIRPIPLSDLWSLLKRAIRAAMKKEADNG